MRYAKIGTTCHQCSLPTPTLAEQPCTTAAASPHDAPCPSWRTCAHIATEHKALGRQEEHFGAQRLGGKSAAPALRVRVQRLR